MTIDSKNETEKESQEQQETVFPAGKLGWERTALLLKKKGGIEARKKWINYFNIN